jgi:hypothetical protein
MRANSSIAIILEDPSGQPSMKHAEAEVEKACQHMIDGERHVIAQRRLAVPFDQASLSPRADEPGDSSSGGISRFAA